MSTFRMKPSKKIVIDKDLGGIDQHHKQRLLMATNEDEENQYLLDTSFVFTQYHKKRSQGSIMSLTLDDKKNKSLSDDHKKGDLSKWHDFYMNIVDPNHPSKQECAPESGETCTECQSDLVQMPQDGMMVCPTCGTSSFALLSTDRPCFKEKQGQESVSSYTYKRINHFNEWLSEFQGKESTVIPDHVFQAIHQEIKKSRRPLHTIDHQDVRQFLKKLKLNRYYEHVSYILSKVTGISPPSISRETEETLRHMFCQLQEPFERHCPETRSNFLSYRFVLRKLFELLGLHQYVEYFTLPRSKKRIDEYDEMWQKSCQELGWEFIRTVR